MVGSLAMDAQGNIAMAYSITGSSEYPGLRYTGRFKNDPLGEMTVPEQTAVDGLSAQTAAGRYGDYSQMTMDPTDDMTFWFTGEYIGPGGSRKTRIFSFSSWHIAGVDDAAEPNPAFTIYQPTVNELKLEWSNLSNQELTMQVVDMSGRHIYTEIIDGSLNEKLIELPSTATGIYMVTLKSGETELSRKIYLGN